MSVLMLVWGWGVFRLPPKVCLLPAAGGFGGVSHHIDSVAYWKCTGVSSRGRRFDARRGGDGGGGPIIFGFVYFSTGPPLVFAQFELHDLS